MTVNSMTGFARVEGGYETTGWALEIRSVNGRGADVKLRLPQGFESIEAPLRKCVASVVRRGSVTLSLNTQSRDALPEVRFNAALLNSLMEQGDALARARGETPPPLSAYLSLRGVVDSAIEAAPDAADLEARDAALLADAERLMTAFAAMRASEGAQLLGVLTGQLDEMQRLRDEAAARPERSVEAVRQRLGDQVAALLEASPRLDEARLHQEAALLATKADIQEELDRLDGHIAAARALFSEDGAIGRKLDFLAQEMNREANTLCSKSPSREMTAIGLALKAVIDQFKEQLQNIE
ncbi:MAG: YicC family protein [Hyphomicrobiaceae bacterium]|nr:YicC family protein [Hyphomicrobiaceae bacterium]